MKLADGSVAYMGICLRLGSATNNIGSEKRLKMARRSFRLGSHWQYEELSRHARTITGNLPFLTLASYCGMLYFSKTCINFSEGRAHQVSRVPDWSCLSSNTTLIELIRLVPQGQWRSGLSRPLLFTSCQTSVYLK